jgi:hypothetical protein
MGRRNIMARSRKSLPITTVSLALAGMLAAGAVAAAAISAPPSLAYAVYLAGTDGSEPTAIAVDAAGNAYVAGSTSGPIPHDPDFPSDIFVTKISPTGKTLFSTFAGTEWNDYASAIALDPSGGIQVAGWVESAGDVQVLLGGFDPRDGSGSVDIPFTSATTSQAYGLAVNARGSYLVGVTNSEIGDPAHRPSESENAPFVAEVGERGVRGSYFAGPCRVEPAGVALDAAGFVYITGSTRCPSFPVSHAAQGAWGGGSDAFVMKLDPRDFSVVYATYLGGSSDDQGLGIAVDPAGHAYVTGWTQSADFPTHLPMQASLGGPSDIFLAELGPYGALVRSTYLGGAGGDIGRAIALGPDRAVYLTGETSTADGRDHAFVTKLDFDHAAIAFTTFLAGGDGIAVDAAGAAVVVSGGEVSRIVPANRPPLCTAGHGSPATIAPPDGRAVAVAISGVTDPEGDAVAISILSIQQDEPAGAPDASGIGTPTARVQAAAAAAGDGRVYHIRFQASDAAGATCMGSVTVCVPHDATHRSCGDGGALYSSTGP